MFIDNGVYRYASVFESTGESDRLDGFVSLSGSSALRLQGQPDAEACPGPRLARDHDSAAHSVDQLFHDRQSKPGSDGALASITRVEVEALESAWKLFRLEARTGVFDRELAGACDNANRSPRGSRAEGVLD